MLIETLVALAILGIIAAGVFLLSVLFIRYIELTSITHEALRFANTPAMRGLPLGDSMDHPDAFSPIQTHVSELLDAYKVFPTHGNAPGRLYIFDNTLSQNIVRDLHVERVRIGNEQESDIIVRATVGAEELLGIGFLPLPSITVESRGPYLFNQDLQP